MCFLREAYKDLNRSLHYNEELYLSRRIAKSVTEGISVADVSVKAMKKSRPNASERRTNPSNITAQAMYTNIIKIIVMRSGPLFNRVNMDSFSCFVCCDDNCLEIINRQTSLWYVFIYFDDRLEVHNVLKQLCVESWCEKLAEK